MPVSDPRVVDCSPRQGVGNEGWRELETGRKKFSLRVDGKEERKIWEEREADPFRRREKKGFGFSSH